MCLLKCYINWERENVEVLHAPLYLCGGDDGDGIGYGRPSSLSILSDMALHNGESSLQETKGKEEHKWKAYVE